MLKLVLALMLLSELQASAATPIDLGPGHQPQVAIAPSGEMLVTFGRDNTIFFTHSADGGKTFDAPSIVAKPKFTPIGMRRGPRIAATQNGVVIAAVAGERGGGKDGDVFVWRSIDDGSHWQRSNRLNFVASAAREGLIGIASDGQQRVFVVWLDDRSGGKEIYGALSTDGGQTFGDDMSIYRSPDGHVCECCHPSAVFSDDGNIYVMFRNWLDGDRDMYIARSRDDGRSFDGSAVKLGTDSWKINGCPMDGGGITLISPDGQLMTAWQRAGSIFVDAPNEPERQIGTGQEPSIAGGYVAWTDDKSNLMFSSIEAGHPIQLANHAADPVLAAAGRHIACTWESNGHSFILANSPLHEAAAASSQPSP